MSRWNGPSMRPAAAPSTVVALSRDVAADVAFQRGVDVAAAGKLQHRETGEDWKSVPYLFTSCAAIA